MEEEIKRLFFGLEIHAPWPFQLPPGRLLDERHRHSTLAFLGNIPYLPLRELLDHFPKPTTQLGEVGNFDSCLLLPPRHPHVVAWNMHWSDNCAPLVIFQKELTKWLLSHHYSVDQREWKPHVTLCRQPFNSRTWERSFASLPFYTSSIHLYESKGNLQYIPIWSYLIQPPFEEIDHTADVAFLVRGETLQQIYLHAFTALSFNAPKLLGFFIPMPVLNNLDEIVITLNSMIAKMDREVGCPMKAVSFHGDLRNLSDSLYQWEMIVDV